MRQSHKEKAWAKERQAANRTTFINGGHPVFANPLVRSVPTSPDPWMVYHQGYYYFTLATDHEIFVWRARSITGIDQGHKVRVWRTPSKGPYSDLVWAPELHLVGDRWYIYFTACDGNNATHRMYVLESAGPDPQGEYTLKGKISDPSDKWAIDGTIIRTNEGLYFAWSGWPGDTDGLQNLYIAPMSNPWTISGERVLLSTPEYGWEGWINEGPQALYHNGSIFLVYSANASWTPEYCLGMLTYNGGDILDPVTWKKSGVPVFQQSEGPDGAVYSTGHCSFVPSPDGREDWIIYHAKDDAGKGWKTRNTRAQPFSWQAGGQPDFGRPVPSGVLIPCPSGEAPVVPPVRPE